MRCQTLDLYIKKSLENRFGEKTEIFQNLACLFEKMFIQCKPFPRNVLKYHTENQFFTFNRDHDGLSRRNYTRSFKGGWWYHRCHEANLNGIYHKGTHDAYADGIN